ncbi:hypothetical protein ABW19_dt0205736 [Dactylella cylindrospora]|nr:hypothetical protein ABW19_dt0205736 [Dactylella cylindrospora]
MTPGILLERPAHTHYPVISKLSMPLVCWPYPAFRIGSGIQPAMYVCPHAYASWTSPFVSLQGTRFEGNQRGKKKKLGRRSLFLAIQLNPHSLPCVINLLRFYTNMHSRLLKMRYYCGTNVLSAMFVWLKFLVAQGDLTCVGYACNFGTLPGFDRASSRLWRKERNNNAIPLQQQN